jgi:hypothetical protein
MILFNSFLCSSFMPIVMKAKQARVECIQKTFLHRKSFFPSFCGVGPLVTENQTLWLSQKVFLTQSKHATNQYKATSSSWLIHRTKLSFTSLNLNGIWGYLVSRGMPGNPGPCPSMDVHPLCGHLPLSATALLQR